MQILYIGKGTAVPCPVWRVHAWYLLPFCTWTQQATIPTSNAPSDSDNARRGKPELILKPSTHFCLEGSSHKNMEKSVYTKLQWKMQLTTSYTTNAQQKSKGGDSHDNTKRKRQSEPGTSWPYLHQCWSSGNWWSHGSAWTLARQNNQLIN
jgi:hypothetical protein